MIQIDDYDLPITAAQKIICGKRFNNLTPLEKAIRVAVSGGRKEGDKVEMFSINEIEEIAAHLTEFCRRHRSGLTEDKE